MYVEGLAHSSCPGVGEGAAGDRGYNERSGARQGTCQGARVGVPRVGGGAGVAWGRPNGRGGDRARWGGGSDLCRQHRRDLVDESLLSRKEGLSSEILKTRKMNSFEAPLD